MDKILYPSQKKYIEKVNRNTEAIISEMEQYAAENRIPILYPESINFLEQLVVIIKPKRVLEIGTAIAYSTIRIAKNLKKKSSIHTIEKSEDNIRLAESFIEKSGYGDKIKIIKGDAAEILPALKKKYDLIFLDADKEDYKQLFEQSLSLLKKGGIIFIDNLLWHGHTAASSVPAEYKLSTKLIRDFNKLFTAQVNLKTSILPIGDGIGLGIKI